MKVVSDQLRHNLQMWKQFALLMGHGLVRKDVADIFNKLLQGRKQVLSELHSTLMLSSDSDFTTEAPVSS